MYNFNLNTKHHFYDASAAHASTSLIIYFYWNPKQGRLTHGDASMMSKFLMIRGQTVMHLRYCHPSSIYLSGWRTLRQVWLISFCLLVFRSINSLTLEGTTTCIWPQ